MSRSWFGMAWMGLAAATVSAWGGVRYVAPGGGNVPPYTNWGAAAHRIQDAIDVAVGGDVVVVSNGIYAECIRWEAKELDVRSLYVETGDRERIAQTVIDGGGTGRTVSIRGGLTAASRLSGFTIRGGHAAGGFPAGFGGGVACFDSGPRLEHLVIKDNRCDLEGGGLYLSSSMAQLADVRLEGNEAGTGGGGMRCSYGSLTFRDFVVVSNRSPAGAGLFFYHTPATAWNVLVADNEATGEGGGAMYFDGCSPTFENATIRNNRATGDGEGGALNVSYESRPTFRNCILWGNQPQQIYFNADWFGMGIALDHCDVEGGVAGVVTLGKGPVIWQDSFDADPLFADAADARLQAGSPCRDGGTNQSWMATATDLAGNPRIAGGTVDVGAYELPDGPVVEVTVPGLPTGAGSSLAYATEEFATGGSSCGDGQAPEYRFDWGDGSISAWALSGTAAHAWSAPGVYDVRAQARSSFSVRSLSAWSAALRIVILNPPPATRYVAPGGGNVPPYTNWGAAAHRIQDAIDVAVGGDVVVVSNGIYAECIRWEAKELDVRSLYVETGDRERIAQTVIDGGGTGRTVSIRGGLTAASRLSGFTIRGGHAAGGFPAGFGGGVACFDSGPRLEHLVIKDNRCDGEGGGLYLASSAAQITDMRLEGNVAGSGGGGMRCSYGALEIRDLVAVSNRSPAGTGLFFYHTPATVRNALVADNEATGEGGGAMYFDGCSPTFENATIRNNRATGDGEGGALNVSYESRPTFRNCILWGNQPQQIYFNADWFGMGIALDHCDVEGGAAGVVTLDKGPVVWQDSFDADPLFADAADARLQAGSPCRDGGTNQSWMATATDLAGNPRIAGGTVDMGAYEFTEGPVQLGAIRCVILPEIVRQLGARWRVAGGSAGWQASGATIGNLEPDVYEVEFTPLSGWTTPDPQEIVLSGGMLAEAVGSYGSEQPDVQPPVIAEVFPWDGYVTTSNKLWMTIVVTDNVEVAFVTVNGRAAESPEPPAWRYEAHPLNGHYHLQEIVATDVLGNRATQAVWYARSVQIDLTALWNGHWRVRNPHDGDFPFLWYVKQDPAENGSGLCPAHRDIYFDTTPGSKHVVLTDTNGVIVDEKGWSPADPPPSLVFDAYVDSDLDGLLNVEEDIAGSDPQSAESRFEFIAEDGGEALPTHRPDAASTSMRDADSPSRVYSWQSSSNSLYSVESSTNLLNWVSVWGFTGRLGSGGLMTYTNEVAGAASFIRLRAERAP